MASSDYEPFSLGPLCVTIINQTLGLNLSAGEVHVTARVHEKIATKHAPDYRFVITNAPIAVANPTFLGPNPDHPGRIDIIWQANSQNPLLVAVSSDQRKGNYTLSTSFRTYSATVSQWLRAGWLVSPKQNGPAEAEPLGSSASRVLG